METFRPAKFALFVPRTFTSLNMLKPSPIRLTVILSAMRKSFFKRRSSELNGLKKLMPPGTCAIGPPELHGKAPGQAGNAFHLLITAFNWSLFLISRASALRGRIGSREPVAPVVLLAVPGRNVSAGTPDPNV